MKRICLGKIVAAHGVKGLVKILPFGDDVSLLEQVHEYKISLKNPLGKYILAEIDGVQDRTQAEELRGTELFVDRSALPEVEEGDGYYLEDLKNLKALNEQGEEIGAILEAQDFGAGTLLDFKPKSGKSFYVPLRDEYVSEINLQNGTATLLERHKEMNFE